MYRTANSSAIVCVSFLLIISFSFSANARAGEAEELNRRASEKIKAGDPTSSIPLLKRAIEIAPAFADAHINLGTAVYLTGDAETAIAHLTRGIELAPRLHQGYNQLGIVYAELKRHEQAVAQFKRAVELKPDSALAAANLAKALVLNREYDRATESFERARQLDPANVEVRTFLGVLYARRSKYDKAIAELQAVVNENPRDENASLALVEVLILAGQRGRALAVYNEVKATGTPLADKMFNSIMDGKVVNVTGW